MVFRLLLILTAVLDRLGNSNNLILLKLANFDQSTWGKSENSNHKFCIHGRKIKSKTLDDRDLLIEQV
jgi:hypothetical protein